MSFALYNTYFLMLLMFISASFCFPEQGRWNILINSSNQEYTGIVKNLFKNTRIYIKINCGISENEDVNFDAKQFKISIGWVLRETKCWEEYLFLNSQPGLIGEYYRSPQKGIDFGQDEVGSGFHNKSVNYVKSNEVIKDCADGISFNALTDQEIAENTSSQKYGAPNGFSSYDRPVYVTKENGDFLLVVRVSPSSSLSYASSKADVTFLASIQVAIIGDFGYLSVVDLPLLPFYAMMCGLYALLGVVWLIVCSRYWRDLLRIQFWIGALICLGMLEKALFCAEFQNINSTGISTKALILTAEVVSCAKRALARMLVVIVSLGFGLVKPRLGPAMVKVLSFGGLYFVLASMEAILRAVKPKNDSSVFSITASIPLAIIDSLICWWVFSALLQTTRTLRLRRNLVKLSVYEKFTKTLMLAVVASVLFMLWSIKYHRTEVCLKDWRNLWVDEAFWHFLFSILLIIIMILWSPSKNNQRYAFTPLLDHQDDCYDSEEDETDEVLLLHDDEFENMKIKKIRKNEVTSLAEKEEESLKWIEENIPQSKGTDALCQGILVDSEEEIENIQFELDKMK